MKTLFMKLICAALVAIMIIGALTSCEKAVDYLDDFAEIEMSLKKLDNEYNEIKAQMV